MHRDKVKVKVTVKVMVKVTIRICIIRHIHIVIVKKTDVRVKIPPNLPKINEKVNCHGDTINFLLSLKHNTFSILGSGSGKNINKSKLSIHLLQTGLTPYKLRYWKDSISSISADWFAKLSFSLSLSLSISITHTHTQIKETKNPKNFQNPV